MSLDRFVIIPYICSQIFLKMNLHCLSDHYLQLLIYYFHIHYWESIGMVYFWSNCDVFDYSGLPQRC